jgi:hypothetical protein
VILLCIVWAALTAAAILLAVKARGRSGFLLILLAGVVIRLIAAGALGTFAYPPGSDPNCYATIAANILSGNGIEVDPSSRAIYPPLYSILLAGLGTVPLNIVIDLGIAATLYVLGRELRVNGKVAAALYLLWPVAALSVTTPRKDTLAILLGAQIGLAAVRLGREWKWWEAVRLGLCAGLMGLTQPAFAPFAAVAALVMAPRRAVRIAAWSVPVAILILLPWWVRNWLLFQAFVPFTTAFGYNMVVAVTGYYAPMKPFQHMPELAGSRAAAHAALQVWTERPLHVLYIRTAAAFKAAVFERAFTDTLYWVSAMREMRLAFVPVLQAYWLCILAGAALGLRKAPRELLWLIAACLIQFALFNFWFEFGERHRYLIVPFAMLTVAVGVGRGPWAARRPQSPLPVARRHSTRLFAHPAPGHDSCAGTSRRRHKHP